MLTSSTRMMLINIKLKEHVHPRELVLTDIFLLYYVVCEILLSRYTYFFCQFFWAQSKLSLFGCMGKGNGVDDVHRLSIDHSVVGRSTHACVVKFAWVLSCCYYLTAIMIID